MTREEKVISVIQVCDVAAPGREAVFKMPNGYRWTGNWVVRMDRKRHTQFAKYFILDDGTVMGRATCVDGRKVYYVVRERFARLVKLAAFPHYAG